MSGVYIKGMEIQKDTPVLFCILPDGKVFADLGGRWREYEAIPVPPHGRLIDADALAEKHRELAYELGGAHYGFHMTACSWIDSSPTIIPTSEETRNG